jgi:lipid A 3-O-deacylase
MCHNVRRATGIRDMTKTGFRVALVAVAIGASFSGHGNAADTSISPPPGAERFGFGGYSQYTEARLGVMAYDRGIFTTDDYSGTVINGELLFRSPEFLSGIGSPRPYLGFDIAIVDDPIHFIYAGLNWDYSLTNRLYISASVGGAITTAEDLHTPTTYKALGCRALVHLGLGIGFDITERFTIQAYADHFSNGNLCEENEGAEAMGVRVGYRF